MLDQVEQACAQSSGLWRTKAMKAEWPSERAERYPEQPRRREFPGIKGALSACTSTSAKRGESGRESDGLETSNPSTARG
jgi:hypothetical protein